jgi:hypothetical protein
MDWHRNPDKVTRVLDIYTHLLSLVDAVTQQVLEENLPDAKQIRQLKTSFEKSTVLYRRWSSRGSPHPGVVKIPA